MFHPIGVSRRWGRRSSFPVSATTLSSLNSVPSRSWSRRARPYSGPWCSTRGRSGSLRDRLRFSSGPSASGCPLTSADQYLAFTSARGPRGRQTSSGQPRAHRNPSDEGVRFTVPAQLVFGGPYGRESKRLTPRTGYESCCEGGFCASGTRSRACYHPAPPFQSTRGGSTSDVLGGIAFHGLSMKSRDSQGADRNWREISAHRVECARLSMWDSTR